ncbi:hypothetical protein GWO43_30255 [candidate division KSB1 bacterium]|nr:hypothetical protein [candidate division KSB1 bacterium]NIV70642.1 hypothetical protein [Phycisphaerae bacterium]NIS28174.1 hypothetical protein [candidate division KSB1 bacterium]NIT75066.1 hypothetical protein [candidate division KSB1 bacterium]NIU28852.1 hypothetical protein [candidate division KSB1 bacterium]
MTVAGHLKGHPIKWDGSRWVYFDTGEPTEMNPRPCGYCGRPDTPEGHDGCLGTLPGVNNACCGHGNEREAYVQFEDGKRKGGREALKWIEEKKNG